MKMLLIVAAFFAFCWSISDMGKPLTAEDRASIHAQAEEARDYLARREAAELDAAQRQADLVAKYRETN
jgi:hypothetical protein